MIRLAVSTRCAKLAMSAPYALKQAAPSPSVPTAASAPSQSIGSPNTTTRKSKHQHVLIAQFGVATAAIALALVGGSLDPLALVGLLAVVMAGLTVFEIPRSRLPRVAEGLA